MEKYAPTDYDLFYCDLLDFVEFEEETSVDYPWAMSADEIMTHAVAIYEFCYGNSDTDCLYNAINMICGIKE